MYDKSIIKPTTYNGINFRSRIEARWAVFMDNCGVKYEYEPETFKLSSGLYVPDFFLIDLDCFLEIKYDGCEDVIVNIKCGNLSDVSNKTVFLLAMTIPNENEIDCSGWTYERSTSMAMFSGGGLVDYHYCWCECFKCGKVGIEFDARSARLKCCKSDSDKDYNGMSEKIMNEYWNARNYR